MLNSAGKIFWVKFSKKWGLSVFSPLFSCFPKGKIRFNPTHPGLIHHAGSSSGAQKSPQKSQKAPQKSLFAPIRDTPSQTALEPSSFPNFPEAGLIPVLSTEGKHPRVQRLPHFVGDKKIRFWTIPAALQTREEPRVTLLGRAQPSPWISRGSGMVLLIFADFSPFFPFKSGLRSQPGKGEREDEEEESQQEFPTPEFLQ